MRFSLKFLFLLTLLIAIGFSLLLALMSIRRTRANTAELSDRVKQKSYGTNFYSQQTESAAVHILQLAKQKQRLQAARDQMGQIFAESAVAESQVNSRDGMLSVREIPVLDRGDGFHKQFRLSVPESRKFQLRLRFEGRQDETGKSVAQRDFEMIERTTVPLNTGPAVVSFSFRPPKTVPGGKPTTKPKLVISVDSQPVFESWFTHSKSNGYSWQHTLLEQQRDYGPNDNKLPKLADFKPSLGETTIVLSIEELQAETGEP